jgi:stage IV sporulation protein FB
MLADPGPTQFDLRFRLFGTNVRVHPLFWLITILFGWSWRALEVLPGNGLLEVALWVVCTFFSILLHEFGHVWMGRAFGSHGHIVLHSMGGLAIGSAEVPYRWQRILVSAAGPGIQLALFGVLMGLVYSGVISLSGDPWGMVFRPTNAFQVALMMLVMINFYWAMVNLLPVWPLDGGWITRDVCGIISPRAGTLIALWISLIVSGLMCLNVVLLLTKSKTLPEYVGLHRYFGTFHAVIVLPDGDAVAFGSGMFTALLFGLFAFSSLQGIMNESAAKRRRYWDDDQVPWER